MTEREKAQRYKELYPKGTRVLLLHMDDPFAVPSGTKGTVDYVDDSGQISMLWDNGRTLAVVPGIDSFRTLTEEEIQEEIQEKEHKEKWDRAVEFGDENRILIPDNPIDCSKLGYFDELENECWDLVKYYCGYMGIELLSENRGSEDISFNLAKSVQEVILNALQEAGVQLDFEGLSAKQDNGESQDENAPAMGMEVM